VNVAVVGGGVIGLCCARSLREAGADVTVLERDRCGAATSLGNAGWITPSLSGPLPAPGTMRQAFRWMLDPGSPLLIRPRLDPAFVSWCLSFWRNCTPQRYRAGMAAVLRLNARTFDLFDEFQADGLDFEMHSTGLLFVAVEERSLREYTEMLEMARTLGYPGEIEQLGPDEIREREPALSRRVIGGIHARVERYVRPETLTAALERWLLDNGVSIREHTEVTGLTREARDWRIATSQGDVIADRVLIAAGVWSRKLLRTLKSSLPLESAKGYSVTAAGSGHAPSHALYLTEAKTGCSPFKGGMRLAGTLELAGLDLSLRPRRLRALIDAASRYLLDWLPEEIQLEWCGLRPVAPDGLPIIGEVRGHPGLFVATGHAMLGITLAPATGVALTRMILAGDFPPELEPFAPQRFTR
jgi:D-amino-acid dehydrogenase